MKQVLNVGFLFNCSMRTNPSVRLSPSVINRVALIDAALRQAGQRVFFYSPRHLTPTAAKVPGYHFDAGRFIATTAEAPLVNGNWTYQTRRLLEKGMGYQQFIRWTERRRMGIYVPYAFSELVADKYQTYKLVRAYHEALHPYCERYRRSARQLEHFLGNSRLVFIKPRVGSKGDRIVTVKRAADGLTATYYEAGKKRRFVATTSAAANELIRGLTRGKKGFLIEQGIETLAHDDSVFDVRVIMFHDGRAWSWVHEARLSPAGSDVSNVGQGGVSITTEDLLLAVLGAEAAQHKLQELRNESFGLAAYLETLHPGDLLEVAFDFVIDQEARLRLVEINTKPGLVGIGFLRTIYDKAPEDEPLFERWVYPHTTALARFLQSKLERLSA